jgi:putative transposase
MEYSEFEDEIVSEKKRTINYINNRGRHHEKRAFKNEFLLFLDKNEIEYDPKF